MIIANKVIEERAEQRLSEYQAKYGVFTRPPVPIDHLIEHHFDLKISWEQIEELNGETIFGALRPEARQIVLNEKHRSLFEGKLGLERSTKGHELGHWDLFVDQGALLYDTFPNLDAATRQFTRRAQRGAVAIVPNLLIDDELYRAYRHIIQGVDPPNIKTAVDRYASALSMPKFLLIPALKPIHDNWGEWKTKAFNLQLKDLYDIAEEFDVTISALKVRLEQLNLIFISEGNSVYRSKHEYLGQESLRL